MARKERDRINRLVRIIQVGPLQFWAHEAFRALLDHRSWARHREPFAKSRRGAQRRAERRFLQENRGIEI